MIDVDLEELGRTVETYVAAAMAPLPWRRRREGSRFALRVPWERAPPGANSASPTTTAPQRH